VLQCVCVWVLMFVCVTMRTQTHTHACTAWWISTGTQAVVGDMHRTAQRSAVTHHALLQIADCASTITHHMHRCAGAHDLCAARDTNSCPTSPFTLRPPSLQDGDEYDVIPDSEFTVARTANRYSVASHTLAAHTTSSTLTALPACLTTPAAVCAACRTARHATLRHSAL
jgi:hypothetical protein